MKTLALLPLLFLATYTNAQSSAILQDCKKPGVYHLYFCAEKKGTDTLTISYNDSVFYQKRVHVFKNDNEIVLDVRKLPAGTYNITTQLFTKTITKN